MKIRTNSTDLMQLTTIWVVKEYEHPGFDIKENDIIIDIGGHIGLFTLFCKQFTKTGKIFSFEPIKENYEIFSENIKMNGIQNIISHNVAVTKTEGEIPIYLSNDESGHSVFEKDTKTVRADGNLATGYLSQHSSVEINKDRYVVSWDYSSKTENPFLKSSSKLSMRAMLCSRKPSSTLLK